MPRPKVVDNGSRLYYVYKLELNKPKLFYIGLTSNLENRMAAHFSAISGHISELLHKLILSKTRYTHHKSMAAEIVRNNPKYLIEKNGIFNGNELARRFCTFTVIKIFDCPQEAADFELELISKYKSNVKFLNKSFISSYPFKNIFKSSIAKKESQNYNLRKR